MKLGWKEVTALKAAEEQLVTAIELFFLGGSEISIHTLARASHEVLERLCTEKGLEASVLREGKKLVKPEFHRTIEDNVNKAKNFFKHGIGVGAGVIEWNPSLSDIFIWDAAVLYRRLGEVKAPCAISAYSLWFRIMNPQMWTDQTELNVQILSIQPELKTLSKTDAYKLIYSICKKQGF